MSFMKSLKGLADDFKEMMGDKDKDKAKEDKKEDKPAQDSGRLSSGLGAY